MKVLIFFIRFFFVTTLVFVKLGLLFLVYKLFSAIIPLLPIISDETIIDTAVLGYFFLFLLDYYFLVIKKP
jgi:hypothetical protein